MAKLKTGARNPVSDGMRLFGLLGQIKRLANEYYELTGRPLGVTGEVAEYEAAELLGLTLADVRQAGYDASREVDGREELVQIKGRCLQAGNCKGRRTSRINTEGEWDVLVLVLLDEALEPTGIYQAERSAVLAALEAPGSKARNERHTLSVSKFKSIGRVVWSPQEEAG